jgi:hypothetical protein
VKTSSVSSIVAPPKVDAEEAKSMIPQPWVLMMWFGLISPLILSVRPDPDLFLHILTGQKILAELRIPSTDQWSFTAAGNVWVNHQWLTQVLLAGVWDYAGTAGLLLLRAVIFILTIAALGIAVWKRLPNALGATLLVCLPLPVYSSLINLRPQSITYLGVAIVLALLTLLRSGVKWPLAVFSLMFPLWANMHAGFPFGLAILCAGILTLYFNGVLSICWAAAFCIIPGVTTLLNPYGIDLWYYIFKEFGAPHPYLPEWNPPEGVLSYITMVAILLPMATVWRCRVPARADEWFGLILAFIMTIRGARFIILEVMLASITMATALGGRCKAISKSRLAFWDRHPLAITAVLILIISFSHPFWGSPGTIQLDPKVYPVTAMSYLRTTNISFRLWCPLGWGGYTLFHLSDRVRIAIDGRNTTVYPVYFVLEQTQAHYSGNLEPVLALDPDVILIESKGPMYDALISGSNFTRIYQDSVAAIFTRPGFELPPLGDIPSPQIDFPG